ncbi:hypothetical protein [Alteromonas sp. CYL-A6]|uniref:hypothetical protein n=1 Tax=Alteromonas nitratireducens TaxID=3390813 RepID=UPI0034BF769E
MNVSRRKQQTRAAMDARILKLHEIMADKVLNDPTLLEQVSTTLTQRYEGGLMRYGSYLLWQGILDAAGEPAAFKALLLANDTRTASLRRETIFTGILSEEERAQILA